jgi:hypothetical protein
MKTDWQALSKKLGVLKEDNSEMYEGINSSQALEEILGDEWLQDAVEAFVEGRPGNELAIKTLRLISSTKAAEIAYKIYIVNKDSNQQKASLAIWALSDIRTPLTLDYVEEFIQRPEYEGIAIGVLRNLIYDHCHWFTKERLSNVLDKFNPHFAEDTLPLKQYIKTEMK